MSLLLRHATLADIPAILKLNNAMCRDEHRLYDPLILPNFATSREGRAYFKDRLTDKFAILLVITFREQVIGYLNAALTKTESYRKKLLVAEISDMAIEKRFRGKGAGQILSKAFTQWATQHKAKVLRVVASAANDNACGFYQKIGLKPVSVTFEKLI